MRIPSGPTCTAAWISVSRKQFIGGPGQPEKKWGLDDLFLSVEVFNLLNINNTIDYTWVQDVGGRYYAIPDFLTPRRLNVKLIARF